MMKIKRIIRRFIFIWQIFTRGWSDEDTYSLDVTIAKFVLPRLQRFKELSLSKPVFANRGIAEEIDQMIFSFQKCAKRFDDSDDNENYWDEETIKKIEEGLDSFAKNFHYLWW